MLEEQKIQEERYKQQEEEKIRKAQEVEEKRRALVSSKLKEDRERLTRSPTLGQLKVMQDRTRVEVQLEEEKRDTHSVPSVKPILHDSLEAKLAICWLEWLTDCGIPKYVPFMESRTNTHQRVELK